jgi:hypothetical protein
MADNKWSKPSNPPPPLFFNEKERNLVKQVNDELLERVEGQAIAYLPISMERTNFHPLYGEAIEKSFLPPVRVYALVEFEGLETTTENFGLDKIYNIIVRFHERRLHADQNLFVREGDYLQYGSSFFEIVSLMNDRPLFGQVNHLFQIEAKCVKTRRGLINFDVLPEAVQTSLVASSEASEEEGGGGGGGGGGAGGSFSSVVRITYCQTTGAPIAAGTSLNSFLAVPSAVVLNTAAVYENGMRQKLTDSPTTGEYYISGGNLYNTFPLAADVRIVLEILTLV